METLFVTDDALRQDRVAALVEAARQAGAVAYEVPAELLVEVSDAQTPQGVVGIVLAPTRSAALPADPNPWMLVVDRVQDPGNLGTLCRTALAASVTASRCCTVPLIPAIRKRYVPRLEQSSAFRSPSFLVRSSWHRLSAKAYAS